MVPFGYLQKDRMEQQLLERELRLDLLMLLGRYI
jgi:hypothetical protein